MNSPSGKIKIKFNYNEDGDSDDHFYIYSLKTFDPNFKIKSKMGLGNTKYECLEAYKDYPNFQ